MYEVGTVNFRVTDEDDKEYFGIAGITLPNMANKVITMNGAGIGGDVDVPIQGHYDAMEITLNFRTYGPSIARLREPRWHHIRAMIAQHDEDRVNGDVVVTPTKFLFTCKPKNRGGGNIAPASEQGASISFSVRRWASYYNGKLLEEVDQLNYKDIINGIDFNADVRRALGTA
jgi:phage tail tube protein FII